jgi:Mrp family chromosome partitioning ATPase/capsular polysaccharide biosynthesis protein
VTPAQQTVSRPTEPEGARVVSIPATGQPDGRSAVQERWDQGPGLIASIWRFRWLVIAVTLLGGLAGFGLSRLIPPEYEASARLFLADPRNTAVLGENRVVIDPERYVIQQAELLTSRPVLERAAGQLGSVAVQDLTERIRVTTDPESDLVQVTATWGDADGAARAAQAVANAFEAVVRENQTARAQDAVEQLQPARADLQQRIDELQARVTPGVEDPVLEGQISALTLQLLDLEARGQQVQVDAASFGSGVEFAEAALPPETPSSPSLLLWTAGGLLLGAAGSTAFAYRRAGAARRVETRVDPARVLGSPLLGEVPVYQLTDDGLAGQLTLEPGINEAYQFVLASIEYALEQVGGSSLMVTSASPGDGKTSTALQVSMTASRDGGRVVLVDGDIRAQGLTRLLGVQDRTGLVELALDNLEVDQSVHYLPVTEELLLPVVGAGRRVDDPGSFFRAPGFRKALQRVKDEAELVVVDSSPLLAVADTSVIGGQVDGIVLVVNRGTPMAHLEQVRERLAFVSTPLLGYVYNRAERARGKPYYGAYGEGSGQ